MEHTKFCQLRRHAAYPPMRRTAPLASGEKKAGLLRAHCYQTEPSPGTVPSMDEMIEFCSLNCNAPLCWTRPPSGAHAGSSFPH